MMAVALCAHMRARAIVRTRAAQHAAPHMAMARRLFLMIVGATAAAMLSAHAARRRISPAHCREPPLRRYVTCKIKRCSLCRCGTRYSVQSAHYGTIRGVVGVVIAAKACALLREARDMPPTATQTRDKVPRHARAKREQPYGRQRRLLAGRGVATPSLPG